MTYPDGDYVDYDYLGTLNTNMNRISRLRWNGNLTTDYMHLGTAMVANIDHKGADIEMEYWLSGTPPTYPQLDNFNRVLQNKWVDYGASPDVVLSDVDYTYDNNSNRITRKVDSSKWDNLYDYDTINRLVSAQRGNVNAAANPPTISNKQFTQDWTLDATGNWAAFNQDNDGDGTDELEQTRGHNIANEITSIGEGGGQDAWANPAYNLVGNMTTIPSPKLTSANADETVTAEYDAWNRLVRIKNDSGYLLAEYEYDGRNFRIIKRTFDGTSSENLSEQRHSYYNSKWQLLEDRVTDTLTSWDPDGEPAERAYLWGKRYIDELIHRVRSTTNNGTYDEKLYAIQDANFNVIGLFDPPSGDGGGGTGLVQRFEYDAYGNCLELKADLSASPVEQADTRDWNIRFAGYRYDSDTAMYYIRNRNYHPMLGTWIQRDPVGYIDGFSLYEYVKSNAMIGVDIYGLTWSKTDCLKFVTQSGGEGSLESLGSDISRFFGFTPHIEISTISELSAVYRELQRQVDILNNTLSNTPSGLIDERREISSALAEARKRLKKAGKWYKFMNYMRKYGCKCEDIRKRARGPLMEFKVNTTARALKAAFKDVPTLLSQLLKLGENIPKKVAIQDLTAALSIYKKAKSPVNDVAQNSVLRAAQLIEDNDCCKPISSKYSSWDDALDDSGEPIK